MADTPQETPRSGFTVDLSSGASGRPKRPKGFVPVVQKTINLTTKKAEPAAESAPPSRPEPSRTPRPEPRPADMRQNDPRLEDPRRSAPKQPVARRPDALRDAHRPSGGTSLADLLDEATLARLRGR